MEKNLPIKIVAKRVEDKQPTSLAITNDEAGRAFKLSGPKLFERSSTMYNFFGKLGADLRRKRTKANYLPSIVKLGLNESAHAKTYRTEINKLFNVRGKMNVIGMLSDDNLLLKIDSEQDLATIQGKIRDADKHVLGISAIDELDSFQPAIENNLEPKKHVKVKLINYGDFRLNTLAKRRFEENCRAAEIAYEPVNYGAGITVYNLSGITKNSLNKIAAEESVYSITNMPLMSQNRIGKKTRGKVSPLLVEKGKEYYKVGVFDEAIAAPEYLSQWKENSYSAFDEGYFGNYHGSFIAGILNYGDILQGQTMTGTKPFKITEAIIFPNDKYGLIEENILVGFMREAVKKFPDVKIWNLSLGSSKAMSDAKYSDFAVFLDALQDEHDIIIVKSAGNCMNFLEHGPVQQIGEGSESIRSIIVGSVAHAQSEWDIAQVNCPSPFSMIGGGLSGVIKPDLVHYGGNAGIKNGELSISGVRSFDQDGKICEEVGTSFSTPRVTALAAELNGALKEEYDPLLIKALLVHSANHPLAFEDPFDDRLTQIGFGLPEKIEDILYNDQDEVTIVMADAIDKGSFINILDFPFPSCLRDNGQYYGQIKMTLVTHPATDQMQDAEYIQSDVDIAFGTYTEKVPLVNHPTKRKKYDAANGKNLLLPSLYGTRAMNNASKAFKAQRFLKSYNDLFVPVKKWCFDLSELQPANKLRYLGDERLWFLDIQASYRNSLETRINKQINKPSLEFALIITLKDEKQKGKLYNEVNRLLTRLNFIHSNIKLDEKIRIRKTL